MLDDPEHAAGLERLVHRREGLRRHSTSHPVVEVAEGDDHVDRVGRHHIAPVGRKSNELHPAVEVRTGRQFLPVAIQPVSQVAARRVWGNDRRVVLALVAHQRRNDFGIPPRFRPDLHHPGLRTQAEEQQGLLWMPERVARPVLLRALRSRKDGIERLRRRLPVAGRRASADQQHGEQPCGGQGRQDLGQVRFPCLRHERSCNSFESKRAHYST